MALVKLTGWNQGKLKRILYFSKGTRIISGAFSKKVKFDYKVLESEKIGKKTWSKAEIKIWVENKNMVDAVEPLFAEAKNLLDVNCGLCHATHVPHEYPANQWPSLIKAMGPRTPMNKDQILLLTQYAQKHAKK